MSSLTTYRSLARSISIVENAAAGHEQILQNLPAHNTPVIGITGPPGAGKSTLTDALIEAIRRNNKTVGVLCVDPSSPFNMGALLGDRIRMGRWYNDGGVYIRSLASRGSLGGLHPRIIEVADVMKGHGFDYIIIETVGIGQSEVDIAGLADITVVVVVPEAGDEIQTMKAGLMEIADIFVVNKADRPDAQAFVRNLQQMLAPAFQHKHANIPIISTVASQQKGIDELLAAIHNAHSQLQQNHRHVWLLAERAYQLIREYRMANTSKKQLYDQLSAAIVQPGFNLYQWIKTYY